MTTNDEVRQPGQARSKLFPGWPLAFFDQHSYTARGQSVYSFVLRVVLGIGAGNPKEGKSRACLWSSGPQARGRGRQCPRGGSFQKKVFCSLLFLKLAWKRHIRDKFSQSGHTWVTVTQPKKQRDQPHGSSSGPLPSLSHPHPNF